GVVGDVAGEEDRPREAVVPGSVMSVVLVRRDRVPAKAAVLGDVERQLVVVTEEDGLAVASHYQLRRQRTVERPQTERALSRQARMKPRREWIWGDNARVELGGGLGVVLRDHPGALLPWGAGHHRTERG